MNAESIMDAIGLIDDSVIAGYDSLRNSEKGNGFNIINWLSIAACISLLVGLGIFIAIRPSNQKSSQLASNPNELNSIVPEFKETQEPMSTYKPVESESQIVLSTPKPDSGNNDTYEDTLVVTSAPESTTFTTESEFTYISQPTISPTSSSAPDIEGEEHHWSYYLARLESVTGPTVDNAGSSTNPNITVKTKWHFSFMYSGNTYVAKKSSINKQWIDQSLGNIILKIKKTGATTTYIEESVALYTIKNITSKAMLAIQISNGEYYMFVNEQYSPDSLATFVNDFDLIDSTSIKYVEIISDCSKRNVMEEEIWNLLLSCEGPISGIHRRPKEQFIIKLESHSYDFYPTQIYAYDKGCISVSVLGQYMCFNVGEDTVNAILENIEDN